MDKETAERIYVTRMARFAAMQNELACMAIEMGVPREAYVSSSGEAYDDMSKVGDTAMGVLRALQTGAKIGDLIKKATDGSN